ncbi:DNA replication protein DnaD [Geobacillus subterraneus]|uniref:DNA replication protein DnaD n=2 Tax=Geobacillus TaxID=129337 RepID=A0ABM6AA33_9BACL|nr:MULTISPECIES: DnaD domain-containing protein [Geobacillus]AMX83129.1 DNA replication protein DnaD [Geobacillus subterraneus]KZS24363.1 DNA replication protein DnaD [Geobacillus subterraneus]OXB91224.1 DNA replication protein DnaD [Geobacillus uzenensis]QIZ68135.1 DnaD domain-containing protein [Geobacillus subterraneus]WPZ17150.1 DnaD domain-containing protein [Geobacillus subterraneus]
MEKKKVAEWLAQGSVVVPKLLLNHYKRLGLSEGELVLLLHMQSFFEEGVVFPTPAELAEKMTVPAAECMEMVRRLLQKGMVGIEEHTDERGVRGEKYTLEPLWEQLVHHLYAQAAKDGQIGQQEEEESLYTIFEQEFGRPLSPFECETLSMWIDQDGHEPAIIKAALREAVLSGKLNFRYIDRILFEWKKNGIRTIEQAHDYGKKFRKPKPPARPEKQATGEFQQTIPFFNWLDS